MPGLDPYTFALLISAINLLMVSATAIILIKQSMRMLDMHLKMLEALREDSEARWRVVEELRARYPLQDESE